MANHDPAASGPVSPSPGSEASLHPAVPLSPEHEASLRAAVSLAAEKLERTWREWPPERPAPVHTVRGKWYRPASLWTDWTSGFVAGQYWILHRLTGDRIWRDRAEKATVRLAPRRFDRDVHDLGFIFLSTYGRWLDLLDPDDPLRARIEDVLVTAGTVQSYRWNGNGPHGFIYSFNGPQSLFVDILMNVRILFRARELGADEEVFRRAVEHCRTSARYLVRRDGPSLGEVDGSVAHEAIFNTEPGRGEFRCLSTQQGWSPFTCWARGLAWAAYGFAEAYRHTWEADFLETAERCAAYYLRHAPADGVPYWDFGAPGIPTEPRDSSAAAILGCALHILSRLARTDRGGSYLAAARNVAKTLCGPGYLAREAGEEGILLHGVYHRPRGWGVDASVPWGDYFFLELLERLLAE